MSDDRKYMARALELAALARGFTSPNPMVGCVVVRDGHVIGEGWHKQAGQPHAEVNAIQAAGDINGATVYITLEPCSHIGKTPPCAPFLAERKPARVVVAMLDPNPKVSGEGIGLLKNQGIEVAVGVLEQEATQLNEAFVKFITTATPFVIAKCGMSLDGKIATRTGDSRWVTGEESRRMVHELRQSVDAIMVGSRTVMIDDPSLTTRLPDTSAKDPIRIILDADNYLDTSRRVFHQKKSNAPTWVAVPDNRTFEGADEVLRLPNAEGGIDLAALMKELGRRDVTSLLIEGGGTTHGSAFEEGIVDKVMFFIAPKIIGGQEAVSAVEGRGADYMKNVVMLERMTARPVGEDILVEAYISKG
jgi:diaminohydroxyphosphoribosylaminopyrimidine deaminase/5-amino-6-(5-phosphoribosylamino)uracil reductase